MPCSTSASVSISSPLHLSYPSTARCLPRCYSSSISVPSQVRHSSEVAWENFCRRVSGEWDGYGAEFSGTGSPLELPSAVVPEAFREWDVHLFDWQTQCPTLAEEAFQYKLIRLLPTVGCEADAATRYSVDERHMGDDKSVSGLLAFHANGSYIAIWPCVRVLKENFGVQNAAKVYETEGDEDGRNFEVEHCFVHEGDLRFRVRILQRIVIQRSSGEHRRVPVLKRITVQREKWESEFMNGELMGGCSTSGCAFAASPTLDVQELGGTWHFETYTAESRAGLGGFHQLVHLGSNTTNRAFPSSLLPLPKGVWSSITCHKENGLLVGAGWIVDSDAAICSSCEFNDAGKAKNQMSDADAHMHLENSRRRRMEKKLRNICKWTPEPS